MNLLPLGHLLRSNGDHSDVQVPESSSQPPVSSGPAEGSGPTGDNLSSLLRTLSVCPATELSWTSLLPCDRYTVRLLFRNLWASMHTVGKLLLKLPPFLILQFLPASRIRFWYICTCCSWLSCSSWCLVSRGVSEMLFWALKHHGWKADMVNQC